MLFDTIICGTNKHKKVNIRGVKLVLRALWSKLKSIFFLFPITSQESHDLQYSLKVPEIECQRAGLQKQSWVRVDEFNVVSCESLFDFEDLKPQGRFSRAFVRKIALKIKEVKAIKLLKKVSRD
ncbi:hypothetical protein [Bartonella sp. MM73XJBT]|uniref:hypothetical protein n=1 Tax=Bartonella sp. MM73XJBT TaxID=3019095 RepID=UPI0023629003|nr:hypothetical protein [Bartonella sp. MM73XJBT]